MEPTKEMIEAGLRDYVTWIDEDDLSDNERFSVIKSVITAALAAMPAPAVADIVPPHCSGSALAFDPGVLHVNKDGSGYIAVDEDDFVLEDDRCEGEHGPEGSVHWIVRLDASEVTALRDFLNGRLRTTRDLAAENERLLAALDGLRKDMWPCVHDGGFDREIGPIGCLLGDKCVCAPLCMRINATLERKP